MKPNIKIHRHSIIFQRYFSVWSRKIIWALVIMQRKSRMHFPHAKRMHQGARDVESGQGHWVWQVVLTKIWWIETKCRSKHETFSTIWYHLCNVRNVENTHGGVLFLVKLHATLIKVTLLHGFFSRFLFFFFKGTKSCKASQVNFCKQCMWYCLPYLSPRFCFHASMRHHFTSSEITVSGYNCEVFCKDDVNCFESRPLERV